MPARSEQRVSTIVAISLLLFTAVPLLAQEISAPQPQAAALQNPRPFRADMPQSHNPLRAYVGDAVPEPVLQNSPRLEQLLRDGKFYVSIKDAIALALENNLDLA